MAIFFTSDTHFGDHRVLNIRPRPFGSVGEMDDALISRWNLRVGTTDEIWHLGDFAGHAALGTPLLQRICHTKEYAMDQTEKAKPRGEFANEGELNETDAAALSSPTGREVSGGTAGRPRSEITGRHDAGSGANETVDGLSSSEEELRRGAEDIPLGAPATELEELPVFDRADALPEV